MSIATKTGDAGTTGLMFNRRVSKTEPRVCAYGAVDELNAAIGLARSHGVGSLWAEELYRIQKELVVLMGELATHPDDRDKYVSKGFLLVTTAMVDRLGSLVEAIELGGVTCEGWDTPGATAASAALHLARTTCRRAEREIIFLGEECREENPEIVRYLNRLADLLWLYAQMAQG